MVEDTGEILMPLCFLSESEDEDQEEVASPRACDYAVLAAEAQPVLLQLATVCMHTHEQRQLAHNPEFVQLSARLCSGVLANGGSAPIAVEPAAAMTAERLYSHVAGPMAHPLLIRGVPAHEQWPAHKTWTSVERLMAIHGNVPLKLFEERNPFGGRARDIRLPLAVYHNYCSTNTADAPFYCFEFDFCGLRAALLHDYSVPAYLRTDLFNLDRFTRETFYSNFRHLIVGGERSGTNLHFDPKGTSAWNALLLGRKKWAFFPPGSPPDLTGAATAESGSASGAPAAYWWLDRAGTIDAKTTGMIECIQEPGDLVFTPPGCFSALPVITPMTIHELSERGLTYCACNRQRYHCVLNLDFSVAVTQNLLPVATVSQAWPQVTKDWPRFANYVASVAPDLVDLIDDGRRERAAAAFELHLAPGARELSIGSGWDGPNECDVAEFSRAQAQ